jgi:hypothetical protein
MRFHQMARRIFIAPALGLALAAAVAACSSSPSTTSTPPATSSATTTPASTSPSATATATATSGGSSSAAVSAITANWEAFFSSSTPNSKRVQLLENGSTFASTVGELSASPLASAVTSTVKSVTLTSSTQATVKYDLTAAGTTVESDASGTAVLQDGVWKVGDDVFCGLLKEGASLMNIKVPAACNSAG